MKPDKLLVIGGSAGSLQVILGILAAEDGFPMPVLVVLHRNAGIESTLEHLIFTRTGLPIKEVEEKDPLLNGTVYLCPADYHVLLEFDGSFSLDYSERVNFCRPSIDVSFRSAADVYGVGVLAILLSGGNADGVEGLQYVREGGGMTVVQDPATAEVPYMPQQAVSRVKPDHILAPEDIPVFIRHWALR
ncbi:MAG TPA: chemotaxis protein CheB [Puia sp.]|nr:chemotaxis protein CheB [Puia sp.]